MNSRKGSITDVLSVFGGVGSFMASSIANVMMMPTNMNNATTMKIIRVKRIALRMIVNSRQMLLKRVPLVLFVTRREDDLVVAAVRGFVQREDWLRSTLGRQLKQVLEPVRPVGIPAKSLVHDRLKDSYYANIRRSPELFHSI